MRAQGFDNETEADGVMSDLSFFLMPRSLHALLAEEAAKRNMTPAQLMGRAIAAYIESPVVPEESVESEGSGANFQMVSPPGVVPSEKRIRNLW